MTKYEELKKVICEALPRLMEIGEGYKFTYEPNPMKNWLSFEAKVINIGGGGQIADTGDHFDIVCDFYSNYDGVETRTTDEISDFEPLGIDPTLSDCLQWYAKSDYQDGINMMKESVWQIFLNRILSEWDLSKPLLKDQSEDLIDYLLTIKK